VSELTDKAPQYEIGCQTEFKVVRPPTPHKMPKLRGVSKKTLTEDNEIFLFDDEVEPILQVLCGKTLEVAQMEVLQEEEIREMQRQQDNYKTMMNNDGQETKRMEEAERKRMEAHEAKKNIERNRKKAKKAAHEKVVCRSMAKNYLRDVKNNTYVLLKDLSFVRDDFREVKMYQNVMPWLMQQAEGFLTHIGNLDQYPTTMIANHIDATSLAHTQRVNERIKQKEANRQAAQRADEEKAAAKLRRKQMREDRKKADEFVLLKQQIEANFIKKLVVVPNITGQEVTDIDGWANCAAKDGKANVTVLGGHLGQLMIVFNALAKDFV
jgi:hypothetical protein